ncbi:GTP pyrophosphokinase family protein [Microbacterium sp. 2FI]|uniref:GTP pyrophosphokinase family protein n=1 Tax=Microbacterium sp. 2FI TaxID=2502193 RepID=UPI0010F98FFA|nr:GTP pyrophosphokinase family protein [Microbacterium sp. 2FI]
MLTCPWTTGELRRLSHQIRDETPAGTNHPSYAEVMGWYNELAAVVQRRIAELNWPPLLIDRPFEVTSRPKTMDTLRQKLQRDHGTPLQNVQDIAGVRFEAEMSLDEQDAVVTAICGVFDHDPGVCVRDMREQSHSGYRGVHIWLRLPARVEVQVRTHLQGLWANTYESAADLFGRGIRYNELPQDETERKIVVGLRQMSTLRIARIEKDRNEIASIDLGLEDLERAGITEIPDDVRIRLDRLKARGQSNEQRLQEDLTKLWKYFDQMRDQRG